VIKIDYPLIQVGTKLYQEESPGKLEEWKMNFAITKYGKDVIHNIEYYIGFCYEPYNTGNKRIVNNRYNLYRKLNIRLKKGEWKTIERFLKHIFGKGSYQMALEYFYNLYLHPIQKLPFLGLVSEKKGTGKSTFLNFLVMIFKSNVSVVSAYDFNGRFNSHYINSLIITSDEHAEEKDRFKIAQKLKMLITEENVRVEAKFNNPYTSKCHFKIVFAGNNEEMLTIIEPENTRYWIVKVEPLLETDIHVSSKLKKEIPAFLHFLKNEFKPKESRGRLYFDPKEFQTEASRLIQENSKPDLQREIEEYIKGLFEVFDILEINYTPKTLAEDLDLSDLSLIREVLKKDMKLKPCSSSKHYHIGCRKFKPLNSKGGSSIMVNVKPSHESGRYYTFSKSDFT